MKNVIITGADGFVGSNTVRAFLRHGVKVLAVDLSEAPQRLEPDENLTYVSCDVSDIGRFGQLVAANGFDALVHFAWKGSAGPGRTDYIMQTENVLNTVALLKLAAEKGCKRFVCAGSIMERETEAALHAQGSRPGMAYIYGTGKLYAHCICKAVAAEEGIELIWPLITNAYGVGELSPRFVNTTIRKIINGEPLQFTAATQYYDFVYVTDVAEAFYLVTEKGKPFSEYLIGSGTARPLKEFILEMQRELAPEAEPIFGDIPFTGTSLAPEDYDVGDIRRDTGFCPKVSFAEGTRLTMEWLMIQEKK